MLIPCDKSYEHYQRFILEIKKWRRNHIAFIILVSCQLSLNEKEHVSKRLSYYNRADKPIGAAQLIADNKPNGQVQSYTFFRKEQGNSLYNQF